MRRIITHFALFLCLLWVTLPRGAAAQSPQVHWARYDYVVDVQKNGDLLFTETQELVVDSGTIRRGRLQFDTGELGRVRQIQVAEDGQAFRRGEGEEPGTFNGVDNGEEAVITYFFRDPNATRHLMTISYVVGRALRGDADTAQLRWTFFPKNGPRIDRASVEFSMPERPTGETLRADTGGMDVNRTVTERGIRWESEGAVQSQQLVVDLVFPTSLVPQASLVAGAPAPIEQPVQAPDIVPNAPAPAGTSNFSLVTCVIILFVVFVVVSMMRSSRRRGQTMPYGGPMVDPFPTQRRRGFGGWGRRGRSFGGYGTPFPPIIPPILPPLDQPPLSPQDEPWRDESSGGTQWSDNSGGGSSWSDSSSGGGSSWSDQDSSSSSGSSWSDSSSSGGSSWSDSSSSGGSSWGGSDSGSSGGGGGSDNSSSFS